jgi:hypothetical protein
MRARCILLKALLLCLAQPLAQVQGAFQNLDFESATLVPIPGDPYNSVQFAQAFPGWTGIVGGVPQTSALYNNYFLDSSGIGIIDSNVPPYLVNFRPMQGRFSAVLQAGWVLNHPGVVANATLSQTGMIPALYNSLLFEAYWAGSGSFGVSVGGQLLPIVPVQSEGNYELYGVDIRGLAGPSVEVDFTAFAANPHTGNIYVDLDAIRFSSLIIPEPGVSALAFLGTLLFAGRFARARRHGTNAKAQRSKRRKDAL